MSREQGEQDDEDDWEGEEDDADDGYIPCPHCGETMLEAADYCAGCDRWITSEELPSSRHSWWIIAIVLILIAAFAISVLSI